MTRRAQTAIVTVIALVLALVAGLVLVVTSGSSGERLGVTMRANLGRSLTIAAGTPVELEVSLTSAPRAAGFDLGGRFRSWYDYVDLEQSQSDGAPPLTFVFVAASTWSLEMGTEGARLVTTTSRVARLEGGRQVHTATFVIAPSATEHAVPGDYQLRAVVETPRWQFWGWRGRAVSAPVTITVKARVDGNPDGPALEAQRLRLTAKYYLSIDQPGEARKSADALVALQPTDPVPLILLGDVLVAENRRADGLDAYRRAMALLPPSYEQPVLLQRRIDTLLNNHTPQVR